MGAGLIVGAWMLALCAYDLQERRLPNWLTLPGAAVILLAAVVVGRGVAAAAGAMVLFVLYLLICLLSPRSMGGGDVKLALGLGALTGMFGADVWALAALGAPLLTAGYAVVVLLCRAGRTVPHGPSMCVASAAAIALAVV
ncbi:MULTISPECIES: A24 family peptidase [unclassified Mycolicibacterium]|uniref:prepilin peptidase n=1 Tax=unclassified Mycolicibacterium TaxID=2636767 RepID=UPI001390BF07|nr:MULTISPECIES: A24 family peptidase [unclassified Mycolicibacterium]MUM07621.1 prepilin peptidase [Mycolicibacterium sp. CBMA 213]